MSKSKSHQPIAPLAAVLAWLVPGLGHVYIGRPVRGIILFLTISITFWSGMAMGGVMTVDARYEKWWFAGQMLTGIHGTAGWVMQNRVYQDLDNDIRPGAYPPGQGDQPGMGQMLTDAWLADRQIALVTPTAGVARAYTGVAGMLNLMCIFDALMLVLIGTPGEPTSRGKSREKAEEGAG